MVDIIQQPVAALAQQRSQQYKKSHTFLKAKLVSSNIVINIFLSCDNILNTPLLLFGAYLVHCNLHRFMTTTTMICRFCRQLETFFYNLSF